MILVFTNVPSCQIAAKQSTKMVSKLPQSLLISQNILTKGRLASPRFSLIGNSDMVR